MISEKQFLQLVGVIFSIVGLMHLLRLLTGFTLALGQWVVPEWVSVIGIVLPWYLAYNAFTFAKKRKK